VADNMTTVKSGGNENVVHDIFGTINTGLSGYFAAKAAKDTSKTLSKAPVGNVALIIGGVVLIFGMVFVLRK
jgi:hypothetical protein